MIPVSLYTVQISEHRTPHGTRWFGRGVLMSPLLPQTSLWRLVLSLRSLTVLGIFAGLCLILLYFHIYIYIFEIWKMGV